jgi:hypothetical protein
LYSCHSRFTCSGIGHPFKADGDPTVERKVGVYREQDAVDAIGGGGSQRGIVKVGGGVDVGRIDRISGNRRHKVVRIGHGHIQPRATVSTEVYRTECAYEYTDIFVDYLFLKSIALGIGGLGTQEKGK